MIEIAKILKAQGIGGEVKVQLFSNNIESFSERSFAYLKDGSRINYSVIRIDKGALILRIDGIKTRNDAEALSGVFLYLDRDDFGELEEGEHYVCDLVGLAVKDEKGRRIGVLKEILQHGAADVYVVKGEKNIMFPALKSVIISIDDEKIVVDSAELDKVAVYED